MRGAEDHSPQTTHTPTDDEIRRRALSKVAWRFLPVLIIAYVLNYLDRTSVGFAALTMNRDIGLTAYQFGWGAGLLFASYSIFEIPSNLYEDRQLTSRDRASFANEPEYAPAMRIALRPVDRDTGQEIERDEVIKGYEYERGQFVTFTPEELKALDVESSHMIDLATFVPRAEVDPVYFNAPYYVYPGRQDRRRSLRRHRCGHERGQHGRAWPGNDRAARANGSGRTARWRHGADHPALG
jgi:hypothetical protein